MRKLLFLTLFLPISLLAQKYTISGTLKDGENGEAMIGAYVYVDDSTGVGTATNVYGFYSLTLPAGKHTVVFGAAGYTEFKKEFDLKANVKFDYELKTGVEEIEAVEVTVEKKTDNFKKVEMSVVKLDIKSIEKIPALLGEPDIVKSVQLLPGVSTIGEGATGFNVRGGGVDQNLVLLDEAPVFNSSHLFGFFSVFNPDAVKNVKLVKGGIPAQYGGRLSSLLDVRMKEGNSKRLGVKGGIGAIFSRLTVEAPIIKDKASFIVAGRRSYADVLAKPFLNEDLKDAKFYFYDLTAKVNYQISDKDKIYLSGYLGRDVLGTGFFFNWGNATSTLRWNHVFNEKLFMNVTAYYSNYDYELGIDEEDDAFKLSANIVNYSVKPELNYYLNTNNTINFGLQSTMYDFNPGTLTFKTAGVEQSNTVKNRYGVESGVYLGNEQKVGKKVILKYGVRGSSWHFVGSGDAFFYEDRVDALTSRVLSEKKTYDKGEVISQYYNIEPRASVKVDVDKKSSVKASYNRMTQYLHLMSNTAAATPLDVWSPTTNNIKPQLADQYALGYFRNFGKNLDWETSVEVYYKSLQNQIGYIPTANLIGNEFYEADLLFGKGRAYGAEFFIKRTTGKLTGWISYTLSRSEVKIDGINNGEYYASRFDKTHVGNLVLNYEFNDRWEASANFVYNTGIPGTFATNTTQLQGYDIPHNPANTRNNSRITDYHRLDLSLTWHGKKKKGKRFHGDWVLSVYNVYNRRNAFTIYLDNDFKGVSGPTAVRYSIIASVVPSITYNFKF